MQRRVTHRVESTVRLVPWLLTALTVLMTPGAKAAEVEADGGITLFVAYDRSYGDAELAIGGELLDNDLTEIDGESGDYVSACKQTNDARAVHGADKSLGSCMAEEGNDKCSGRTKLDRDLRQLARHIYESTQGAHYLKRVFVADQGRFWGTADMIWDLADGASESGASTAGGNWTDPEAQMRIRNAARTCIHDVAHHELGHFLYGLSDRYPYKDPNGACKTDAATGAQTLFDMTIVESDSNSFMNSNFPHRFVDEDNAKLRVDYGSEVDKILDKNDFGPNRSNWPEHRDCSMAYGRDEWTMIQEMHTGLETDLAGNLIHTPGDYPEPDFSKMHEPDICFLASDQPVPGIIVLLDSANSNAIEKAYEAALYLYHSSSAEDYVGAYSYDQATTELFKYGLFEETRASSAFLGPQSPFFRALPPVTSATNLAKGIERAIDELKSVHTGLCGPAGSSIIVMSDGKSRLRDVPVWEQVERAADLGIAIRTLIIGVDEDPTTMRGIAESSYGSVTVLSGAINPLPLKLEMVQAFNRLRGYEQILNGQSPEDAFDVPYASRNMLFYVLLSEGSADSVAFKLCRCLEEDCAVCWDHPSEETEEVFPNLAEKGGFTGVRLSNARAGEWRYKVTTSSGAEIHQVMAMVRNPNVYSVSLLEPRGDPDHVLIDWPEPFEAQKAAMEKHVIDGGVQASVRYRYPLLGVQATASVYDGPIKVMEVEMRDGGRRSSDLRREDGIYSTPPSFFADLKAKLDEIANARDGKAVTYEHVRHTEARAKGKAGSKGKTGAKGKAGQKAGSDKTTNRRLRVEVELKVGRDSFPADVPYEPGTKLASLAKDYERLIMRNGEKGFSVYASTTVDLNPVETEPPSIAVAGIKKGGRPHRPGGGGKLIVLVHSARPLRRQLRVSLGQGISTKVMHVGPLGDLDADVVVVVSYHVTSDARKGKRHLRLQFGETILERQDILRILK